MADVHPPATPGDVFANGARLVGDFIMPGASQAVNGDIRSGAAHAAVALGAATLLGGVLVPIVWAAAGLNSFSRSVTGHNVARHFDWRNRVDD